MLERVKLPNGWSAAMTTHFPRRPIHNHAVPRAARQKQPVMVQVFNPDTGEPLLDESLNPVMVHAKRVKMDPNRQKPMLDRHGRLQMEEAYERPSPRVPPEVATTTIILTNPDGKDLTFFGDAFLHWKDVFAFSREIGFKISAGRALRLLNQLKWIPKEVRLALSAWVHGLPGDVINRLIEHIPEKVQVETTISANTVSDDNHRKRRRRRRHVTEDTVAQQDTAVASPT
jgi:hypothetical protein